MTSPIVIIGAGGHAVSVFNVAISCQYDVIAFVDDHKVGSVVLNKPVISSKQFIIDFHQYDICIAIGDNATRETVYKEYKTKLPDTKFPVLVHQSSIIGEGSVMGEGSVVMPLVNIGPNSVIGNGCIINSNASIDHDCNIGDFASIAPGVVCGGGVTIGKRSAISIGATIKHNIAIGKDTVIGGCSYVHASVEDEVVSYGIPSKKIKNRKKDDPYLM